MTAPVTSLPSGIVLPVRPDVDHAALAARRLRRLRDALAEAPFDAIVLTDPDSVVYATGYRSMPIQVFRTHRIVALVTGDDLWLVCAASDGPAAAAAGVPVDRLVPFGRFYVEAVDDDTLVPLTDLADRNLDIAAAVRAAVARLPAGSTIAVEGSGANPDITAALGAADLDDGGLVASVRAVKLPDEVAMLRYTAHLSEVAVQAALAVARLGTTERELSTAIAATMVAGGGDPRFVVAATGDRSALADVMPTDRPWRPGETARFDVGCIVDGYWSDIGRTAVLGEPDRRQRDVYAAVYAGEQDQLDRAAPGVTAGELFRIGFDGTGAGVPRYRRQHCGHGIGMSIYEPPVIADGVDVVLEAGMTFCFETPYYELGWGGMMVEDTVVVTTDGVEVLSGTGRELAVVSA